MALSKWTNTKIIDQISTDSKWNTQTIAYNFPSASSGVYGTYELSGFTEFNLQQKNSATLALNLWDELISPSLVHSSDSSNIEFGNSSSMNSFAHAYQPSTGTVWMSIYNGNGIDLQAPQKGDYANLTYLHEIGHSFGLDHSGNYNGSGNNKPSNYYDSHVYSIMSYFGPDMGSGASAGYNLVAWGDWTGADGKVYSPQTPMVHDILAIQSMYGADTTTRSGDTVYGFNSNISGDLAAIFDFSNNSNPILTIYDGGGEDTIDLSGFNGSLTLDLNEGGYSSANSMTNNIAIAYGAKIEKGVGGSGADTIIGNKLNNILDGKSGADVMLGGDGNDIYYVDNQNDKVYETTTIKTSTDAKGDDEVRSSVSFTIGNYIEKLTLQGDADINGTGSKGNNILTGNSGANILDGGAGNDTLQGGGGDDTLLGGAGDDIYYIDSANDKAYEYISLANQKDARGTDTVYSGVTFVLSSYIENLILSGSDAINGGGNDLKNQITGNGASNTIDGGKGDDILDGGEGADILAGGLGKDIFIVDNIADVIVEDINKNEIDTVKSYVNYILSSNVENIILQNNESDGSESDDNNENNINATGNELKNTLTGNNGDNILDGGAGADKLVGGNGNDIYIIDDKGDKITETATGGVLDKVQSYIDFTIIKYIEEVELVGNANAKIFGATLNDILKGNDANNTLDGKKGADTMSGKGGDDIYIVDDAGDRVIEEENGGIDSVQSAVTFSLGDNIEKLTLTGTQASSATGNALGNVLTGNKAINNILGGGGDDLINGDGGNDILSGGDGADKFYFTTTLGKTNIDTITDFSTTDYIYLGAKIFSKLGLSSGGSLGEAYFYKSQNTTQGADVEDRIVYDSENGNLYYDPDGSGRGASVLFATLSGSPDDVAYSNFMIA